MTLTEAPAPELTRDYECSNTKLSQRARLHPEPLGRRGGHRTCSPRIDLEDRTTLTDPRHYNIRWLELLNELKPAVEQFDDRPVSSGAS